MTTRRLIPTAILGHRRSMLCTTVATAGAGAVCLRTARTPTDRCATASACFRSCSSSMSSAPSAQSWCAGPKLGAVAPRMERMRNMPTILPQIDEADGVLDELQAWFLLRAEAEHWVYTSVLRQLVNRMY